MGKYTIHGSYGVRVVFHHVKNKCLSQEGYFLVAQLLGNHGLLTEKTPASTYGPQPRPRRIFKKKQVVNHLPKVLQQKNITLSILTPQKCQF